jgi:hypothetical protein
MIILRTAAAALAACALWAQSGTTPKAKPEDYPARGRRGDLEIAAEYLVRSFSAGQHSYFAPDHLVVEVAFFPPKGGSIDPAAFQFLLCVNRKTKEPLMAESPGMVAASFKYSDWQQRARLEAGAGMGDAGVIVGRRQPTARFPGDRREPSPRIGMPPRSPTEAAKVERQAPPTADEAAIESALPSGAFRAPVSGHVYFAFGGKTKSIKSLELIVRGADADTVIRLM